MGQRILESMTLIHTRQYNIRIWRNLESDEEAVIPDEFVINCMKPVVERNEYEPLSCAFISKVIDMIPGVAAYEILNKEGNGFVIYPDWP